MSSLTGKSCVVTGASRGLGRAIALAYAAQGADLVLTARSRDDLERLRAEIEALGRRAEVRVGDVTDLAHLRAVGAAAVSAFGKLDVWVNNAGGDPSIVGGWTEWLDVTEEGWERMLCLNLKAQVFGAQIAARLMRDGATGGSIIFLSSIDSLYAAPGGEGIYGACKAAINNVPDHGRRARPAPDPRQRDRARGGGDAADRAVAGDGSRPPRPCRLLSAPPRGPAGRRRRRRRVLRLRRGRVGVGVGAAGVGRRGDDQRPLPVPHARQQGERMNGRRDPRRGQKRRRPSWVSRLPIDR